MGVAAIPGSAPNRFTRRVDLLETFKGTKSFLGDGEFDGTDLQQTMNDAGWWYACRTAKRTVATWEDLTFHLDFLGSSIKRGMLIELKEAQFTRNAYGPVMVLCCWAKGEAEPLYLVRNMSVAEEAIRYDQKRFRIETFFSDQKSRGFNIQKSHIEDPQRLSRLLIATCLAYIWIVYLGSLCKSDGWQAIIHRRNRCIRPISSTAATLANLGTKGFRYLSIHVTISKKMGTVMKSGLLFVSHAARMSHNLR